MKNELKNNKFKTPYILIPVCFFVLWVLGVCFVVGECNPSNMTEANRFVIAWFGMCAALLGFILAKFIYD